MAAINVEVPLCIYEIKNVLQNFANVVWIWHKYNKLKDIVER